MSLLNSGQRSEGTLSLFHNFHSTAAVGYSPNVQVAVMMMSPPLLSSVCAVVVEFNTISLFQNQIQKTLKLTYHSFPTTQNMSMSSHTTEQRNAVKYTVLLLKLKLDKVPRIKRNELTRIRVVERERQESDALFSFFP